MISTNPTLSSSSTTEITTASTSTSPISTGSTISTTSGPTTTPNLNLYPGAQFYNVDDQCIRLFGINSSSYCRVNFLHFYDYRLIKSYVVNLIK